MQETQRQDSMPEEQEEACRRRAARIPMPIEVQFIMNGREVAAIIRDVSVNESAHEKVIGVGVLHGDFLPLDESISCRIDSSSETLPEESQITLMWTRHFGSHGYLSGGRMTPVSVNALDRTDTSRQA